MYSRGDQEQALEVVSRGLSLSEAARRTGIHRSTLRAWRDAPVPRPLECPRCDGFPIASPDSYVALLGFYLGDGCLSLTGRCWALRVSCDARLPGIVDDVEQTIRRVRAGGRVHRVNAPGVVVVQSNWKHWPCLFPQHGPGRKHERPIVLEPWQREVVEDHPAAFLRGLFHSDGCRVANWARRPVAGRLKRYDYPRWQFSNASLEIRELCCWALDLAGVAWRQSGARTISVSRREAVGLLDELIGLKS